MWRVSSKPKSSTRVSNARTKGREVVTTDLLKAELQVFMQDTLQDALTALGDHVLSEVRKDLQQCLFEDDPEIESDHDPKALLVASMRPFSNRYCRINRHRDGLSDNLMHTGPSTNATSSRTPRLGDPASPADSSGMGEVSPAVLPSPILDSELTALLNKEGEPHCCSLGPHLKSAIFVSEAAPDDDSGVARELSYLDPEKSYLTSLSSQGSSAKHHFHRFVKKAQVKELVQSAIFEQLLGLLVLCNAVLLGFETDYYACTGAGSVSYVSKCFSLGELGFCICFTLELALRLYAYGFVDFFVNASWAWNVFDCVIVGMQVVEQLLRLLTFLKLPFTTGFYRALRLLRLVRITRLVRIVRVVEELHTILYSIMSSMTALFWTLTLLMMLIYIFSVLFTQVVLDAKESSNVEKLEYWFGRLPRSCLTLFEVIVGGVSWDEVAKPLIEEISPWMGPLLCAYIAFCVFAMMNMATGVFVDRATRKAQEDRDTYTANHMSELFFNEEGSQGQVSFDAFNKKMDTADMQEYFKAIDVDPSEAKGLFQLLDADDSGTVDAEELVNGCLRLRGCAKALELSLLMHETSRMHSAQLAHQAKVELGMAALAKLVMKLSRSTEQLVQDHPGDDEPEVMEARASLQSVDRSAESILVALENSDPARPSLQLGRNKRCSLMRFRM